MLKQNGKIYNNKSYNICVFEQKSKVFVGILAQIDNGFIEQLQQTHNKHLNFLIALLVLSFEQSDN
jgi:hypothetical protein